MLKRIVLLLVVALMASPLLFAQITTSAVNGTVKNNADEPLVGATIVATHQPSGTKYSTVSRAGGQFSIQNMRVGGPYLIEVSFVGHEAGKFENVYLQLAESFLLNAYLNKTSGNLENVVLTSGRKNSILNASRTGSVTNIGIRQISQLPTISRSINDLSRTTPQSFNNAFGGGNYRQSNFTVDGAEFNNSFGIGTSNLPAGGSPISLDALDEISINLTPFDVRQSGFIGSAINAVTRSGTNIFSGSVYSFWRNEKQRGYKVGNTSFTRAPEEFKQVGFRIGGPIIKNKLFFFFNYESDNQPRPLQTRFAATPSAPFGSSDNIVRPTADSMNYISKYLFDKYGYVTGPYDNYTPNIEKKKVLARIDWNINSKHKMNFRYSQVIGGSPSAVSTSLNSAGTVAGTGATRTANTGLWFKNSNYLQGENYYSFSTELNSNLGRVSNTFRAAYTFQNEDRSSESQIFPFVDILSTTGVTPAANTGLGVPYASFGYEPFSFGNLRRVKMYSVVNNLSWTTNKHSWFLGAQIERSETVNGFQPFGTSYYRFATWADFASALDPNPLNRKLPTDFTQTFSLSKGFAPAFSSYKFVQYSLYGQDDITINRQLKLTLGLRLELPTYPDVPQIQTNPLLAALNFENGEKINTGIFPSGKIMFSPRVGFNWDIYGDRSLQIRGGTGIFTGKIPNVWVVSQSGNSNMIQVTQAYNTYTGQGLPTGILPPGPFNPNPVAYRPSSVPAAGTSVNANSTTMDPDFKNPQSWKSSLGFDTKLPTGIVASVEAIFNKDLYTIFPRNPNLKTPTPLNIAGYPDNRLIYGGPNNVDRFINTLNGSFVPAPGATGPLNPIIIDNGQKGYYFSLTAKLEKPFSKGLYISLAYTKSLAGNLHDGGGDQLSGVWQGTASVNGANLSPLSYADYVIPDRVVGIISYKKEYLKHLATTVTLLYTGNNNGRFSYTYSGDFNRDGVTGNDLLYIPTESQVQSMSFANNTVNGVVYDQTAQRSLFENYIRQDKYLRAHRGQYAERNGGLFPWLNRLDMKLAQDITSKLGKNRNTVQFTLDILNFGNLINSDWGKLKSLNTSAPLVLANNIIPGSTTIPQFRLAVANSQIITNTFRDNVSINSTYSIQFGLRYLFN